MSNVFHSTAKDDQFVVLQPSMSTMVGAGVGNDTYLLSRSMLPSGTNLTISDAIGSNSIQLASGLKITSSQVASNALKLTLDTGATVTILGANKFTYDLGGNTSAGIDQVDVSYATLVQGTLGVTLPTSGVVTGGAVTIGGSTSNSEIVVAGNASVPATVAADVFYFDAIAARTDAAGTNTQATITGFATQGDILKINLPNANPAITTLNQLSGQQGVFVDLDPFDGSTVINFGSDSNGGQLVTLSLTGITNTDLVKVQIINGTSGSGTVTPVPPAASVITLTSSGAAGTANADIFAVNVAAALADTAGTNFQPSLTGFSTTSDKLRIDLLTANTSVTKLSQLNGQQGVSVSADPFSGNTLISFGNDLNGGEVAVVTLVGVTDASATMVEIV